MKKTPVVIITGAARGLGRDIALHFSQNGYSIGLNYNESIKEARDTEKQIKINGVDCLLLKGDVSVYKDVVSMVKMVSVEWGRIDVLINNAGTTRDRTLSKMREEEWKKVMAVNLDGPFFCSRAVLPMMREQKRGHIINMISYLAKKPAVGAANYAVSKAGLVALTKSMALEEGPHNIRVNAVMPGFHVTDMNKQVWSRYEKLIRNQHLIETLPKKKKLAEFIYRLNEFDNISGQEFAFESRLF